MGGLNGTAGAERLAAWVWTAKNGYAWQGAEKGEDGRTGEMLQQALEATEALETAGAVGAMARRPMANRRLDGWPERRLCTVLFRFHPKKGVDWRGRSCDYTVAACHQTGRAPVDLAAAYGAPEMAEVRREGLDGMWVVAPQADFTEETAAKPDWLRPWKRTMEKGVLETLGRWFQSADADLGDLKAVLLGEKEAKADALRAVATYAPFPQVTATEAASAAWSAAEGGGGDASTGVALEAWRTALAKEESLNRMLGGDRGLPGLNAHLSEHRERLELAVAAVAERKRRRAEAETELTELASLLRDYRMPAAWPGDEEQPGGSALEELSRKVESCRKEYRAWMTPEQLERLERLNADVSNLGGRVRKLSAYRRTMHLYEQAAEEWRGLPKEKRCAAKAEAKDALEKAMKEGKDFPWALDALKQMERMFANAERVVRAAEEAPRQKPETGSAAPGQNGRAEATKVPEAEDRKPIQAPMAQPSCPPGRDGRSSERGLLGTLLGAVWPPWRYRSMKERAQALARAWKYGKALEEAEKIPETNLLTVPVRERYISASLLAAWKQLHKIEHTLRPAKEMETKLDAQEAELNRECPQWMKRVGGWPSWKAYQEARKKGRKALPPWEFGEDGRPKRTDLGGARNVLLCFAGEMEKYGRQFQEALDHLTEAEKLFGQIRRQAKSVEAGTRPATDGVRGTQVTRSGR